MLILSLTNSSPYSLRDLASKLTSRILWRKGFVIVAKEKRASPSWITVKAALLAFDRAGLLGLVQDLYAASKDNQAFLHARLGLGDDQLRPYKARISRWISPDMMRNQRISIATAKKAI